METIPTSFPSRPLFPTLCAAVLAALSAASTGVSQTVPESSPPSPIPTLADALAKAKEDGRLVCLQFKSFKCPHCRAFAETVGHSAVYREFVAARLHLVIYDIARDDQLSPEQFREMKALMVEHSVKYTPTFVILSREGTVLLRIEGYKNESPEAFVAGLAGIEAAAIVPDPGRRE